MSELLQLSLRAHDMQRDVIGPTSTTSLETAPNSTRPWVRGRPL